MKMTKEYSTPWVFLFMNILILSGNLVSCSKVDISDEKKFLKAQWPIVSTNTNDSRVPREHVKNVIDTSEKKGKTHSSMDTVRIKRSANVQNVSDSTTQIPDHSRQSNCRDHTGREYIMMFPFVRNDTRLGQDLYYISRMRETVEILITSKENTSVEIESPFPGVSRTVQVNSSKGKIVSLPRDVILNGNTELKGIALKAQAEISVYGVTNINKDYGGGEAFSAIPTKFLSTMYYTTASLIAIVALYDDTRVNITVGSRTSTYNSKTYYPNNTFQVYLSRLRTFQLFGPTTLEGTSISSDKVIAVMTGSQCYEKSNWSRQSSCNQLLSAIPPRDSLGQVFIVPQITKRDYFQIYYDVGSTQSRYNLKNALDSYYASSSYEWRRDLLSKMAYVVESKTPGVLMQYTKLDDNSTPSSQVVIPAISQYSNNYRFITPTNYSEHWIAVMIPFDHVRGLRIDGRPVDNLRYDFEAVTVSNVLYCVISVKIGQGQHDVYHVDNDVTFGLLALGFNKEQAYAFPVGLYLGGNNCNKNN